MVIRHWLVLPALAGVALMPLAAFSAPALAQDDPAGPPATPACAATGYLVGPGEDLAQVRAELGDESVHLVGGVPLESGQTWVIPDGSQPVVVVDSTEPLTRGTVLLNMAGQEFEAATRSLGGGEEPQLRYVSGVELPHLGPTVRTLGLTVQTPPCGDLWLTVSVERSVWSTVVGGPAIAATALFGLLVVWVARLRKGGWLRRFASAAPFGLLAGVAQVAVLVESGAVSPFDVPPWWVPLIGLVLAAVLPLTRWRRRRKAPSGAELAPPDGAALGGYRIDHVVARTDVAVLYRATRLAPPPPPVSGVADGEEPTVVTPPPAPPEPERVLLKVASAPRFGEPEVRLRLEREAQALAGLAHPNILALRESLPAAGGPPTLVFDDVEGAPLRQLLGGGSLSGPQVVNVVLGVLAGLGAVHGRGLVHRDVRPENVWLATDGGVLLAGFESAVAGVEHAVAPEGQAPYASPEQRAGQPLDERSDLWSCGVLLTELLTGQVPPHADGLPESLAGLLGRVLAEDPADRPASAEQFATELRAAAEAAFGTDWAGRGVLAGALVAHGAVGAGAAGYALAGGAAGGAAGGGAAGGGTAAGLGAAGAAGVVGAPGAAVTGAGSAAAGTSAAGATTASVAGGAVAASVAGAGQGASGPVTTVVNAGVAVCAAAAVAVTAVLVDPEPAAAEESEVITPDQARVIFVRTVDQGWGDTFDHFSDEAEDSFQELADVDDSVAGGGLTEVAVGVPPEQHAYPAWFMASAAIPYADGEASLFARFDREADGQPWLLTTLAWSTDQRLPAALPDDDGWLAPAPDPAELAVAPEDLPDQYGEWFIEQFDSGGDSDVAPYERLEWLPHDGSYLLRWASFTQTAAGVVSPASLIRTPGDWIVSRFFWVVREQGRWDPHDPFPSTEQLREEMWSAPVVYEDMSVVPLVDGTALVSFVVTSEETITSSRDGSDRIGQCGDTPSFRYDGSRYRVFAVDYRIRVHAWVPPAGGEDEPILATDPIIGTTVPSDRAELC